MKILKIKIEKGQEVIEVLSKEIAKLEFSSAAIVSIIGAVDSCCISNMPHNDAQQDIPTEYNVPMELSGSGEIRDGKPHIHCTLSAEDNNAVHGHLLWAKVQDWYVAVYLLLEP